MIELVTLADVCSQNSLMQQSRREHAVKKVHDFLHISVV